MSWHPGLRLPLPADPRLQSAGRRKSPHRIGNAQATVTPAEAAQDKDANLWVTRFSPAISNFLAYHPPIYLAFRDNNQRNSTRGEPHVYDPVSFHNLQHPPLLQLLDIGSLFEDEPRRQAISLYLRSLQPNMVNIAALQEVWWAEYAHEIAADAVSSKSYLNRYVADDEGHLLNPPGLMLLGDSNCNFKKHAGWESYKDECGELPTSLPHLPIRDGWDSQDTPVRKGRIDATCQFQCSAGDTHTIGLFTTHMPVEYGSHTPKVSCSFNYLTDSIAKWRTANGDSAVFLLGDLNIDILNTDPTKTFEYTDTVENLLIGKAGLVDPVGNDPKYATIVPNTNLTWQHFNDATTGNSQRIDYFMYASSTDGKMTVTVDNINVNSQLTIPYDNANYACSDHYPLEVIATITINE